MAVTRQSRPSVEDYVQEIEGIIRTKFPDAEFEAVRRGRKEVMLYVEGRFKNMFDVLDLVAERTTDILIETGIEINLVPLKTPAAKANAGG